MLSLPATIKAHGSPAYSITRPQVLDWCGLEVFCVQIIPLACKRKQLLRSSPDRLKLYV